MIYASLSGSSITVLISTGPSYSLVTLANNLRAPHKHSDLPLQKLPISLGSSGNISMTITRNTHLYGGGGKRLGHGLVSHTRAILKLNSLQNR